MIYIIYICIYIYILIYITIQHYTWRLSNGVDLSLRYAVWDVGDVAAGADVETRQEIFEQLLPEETFVDRRLMTEAISLVHVGALSTE